MAKFKNIQELFLTASAHWSNNVAFRHIAAGYVREFKYACLSDLSYKYAQWLSGNEVRPHDRIALWTNNSPESVLACIAALRLGVVVCPIDDLVDQHIASYSLNKAKPKLILVGARQQVVADEAFHPKRLPTVEEVLKHTNLPILKHLGSPDKNDTAFIVAAHDTADKDLVFSHGMIVDNAIALSKKIGLTQNDRLFAGQQVPMLLQSVLSVAASFFAGSTVIFSSSHNESHLQELFNIEEVSILLGAQRDFAIIVTKMDSQFEALSPSGRIISMLLKPTMRTRIDIGSKIFPRLHENLGGKIKLLVSTDSEIEEELLQRIRSFRIPFTVKEQLFADSPDVPSLAELFSSETPPAYAKLTDTVSKPACETELSVDRILSSVIDPEIQRAINPSGSSLFSLQADLETDLGLDLLARIELHNLLQQNFSMPIDYSCIHDASTVADILSIVKYPPSSSAPQPADRTSVVFCKEETTEYFQSTPWPHKHKICTEWPYNKAPLLVTIRTLADIGFKFHTNLNNSIEKRGADRLMMDPPYILAVNNGSTASSLAILTCFPANLLKLVHPVHSLHTHFTYALTSALSTYILNAVPFDEFNNLQESLNTCERLLKNGEILVMYPEASTNHKVQQGNLSPWVTILANRVGCPVIPTYVSGAKHILPPWAQLPHFESAKVTFGLPLYPAVNKSTVKEFRKFTQQLLSALESLHPQAALTHQLK